MCRTKGRSESSELRHTETGRCGSASREFRAGSYPRFVAEPNGAPSLRRSRHTRGPYPPAVRRCAGHTATPFYSSTSRSRSTDVETRSWCVGSLAVVVLWICYIVYACIYRYTVNVRYMPVLQYRCSRGSLCPTWRAPTHPSPSLPLRLFRSLLPPDHPFFSLPRRWPRALSFSFMFLTCEPFFLLLRLVPSPFPRLSRSLTLSLARTARRLSYGFWNAL